VNEKPLRVERDGKLLILTLDDPSRRNALSEAMMAALVEELAIAGSDPALRCVILAGEGPAFCSGHDLKAMTAHRAEADQGRNAFELLFAACSALMLQMRDLPKPVIAAVEGVATAAGCQLVASADLAIAGREARFFTPGVNIGLFCSTPMVALSRAVGRKAAMEMLLTGEATDAQKAQAIGLINRVVPAGQALAAARKLGYLLASKPQATLAIGKRAFYNQAEMTLDEAYAYAAKIMTENMLHRDSVEGIGAFLEKRKPDWA
jgi:enoyl-CoA hydratase/carnithine racemase